MLATACWSSISPMPRKVIVTQLGSWLVSKLSIRSISGTMLHIAASGLGPVTSAAVIAAGAIRPDIVAHGIHDEGRAAELIEGKEARARRLAHHGQRRFAGFGDARQRQSALYAVEQGGEERGMPDEIRRHRAADL